MLNHQSITQDTAEQLNADPLVSTSGLARGAPFHCCLMSSMYGIRCIEEVFHRCGVCYLTISKFFPAIGPAMYPQKTAVPDRAMVHYGEGPRAFVEKEGEIPVMAAYRFAWFAFHPETRLVGNPR